MGIRRHSIEQAVDVAAPPETVWREVTEVDIAAFSHSPLLALLGIPKPLRAEILRPGVGGARVAHFANNRRFSQAITAWEPPARYAFTFSADPGFRVVYVFDLADGPFRMVAGAYRLRGIAGGTRLALSSQYELRGAAGACIAIPVRLVMGRFQDYLLRGIKRNAELRAG